MNKLSAVLGRSHHFPPANPLVNSRGGGGEFMACKGYLVQEFKEVVGCCRLMRSLRAVRQKIARPSKKIGRK
jgi:hypothetical protein